MTWVAIGVAVVGGAVSIGQADKARKKANQEADKQELLAEKASLQTEYESGKGAQKRKETARGSSLLGSTGYSQGSTSLIK